MTYKTALFKIGGTIFEDFENLSSTISQFSQLYEKEVIQKIILIPGGGSFATT